jgi:signal transduction histidine kinase
MAAHVAHEVRNNLVPVKLYLSLLRRRLSDDRGSLDVLRKVESGFTSLETTVGDLLNFTADRDPRYGVLSLRRVVDEVCQALGPQLKAQRIDVELDIPPPLTARADEEMLRKAVLNLVLNALDAMPNGGELVVTAFEGSNAIELEVADSGPGLPAEYADRVFEPFFTTKSGGTGLGLAIVKRVVEAHGGTVTALNCPEGGSAFTLELPKARREALAA